MAEKNIKNGVKKPNFFIYTVPSYLFFVFAKLYWKLKVDNKEIRKIKSPILAVAPHSSTLDIVSVVMTLLPKRYNVVAGRDLFTWKQLRPFIKAFGAIPKDQCSVDLGCLRTMKKAVEGGNNILLYPEGRTSLDGKQCYYLAPSIGKLVKFLGCTVVMVENHGSYLTKPRYMKGFRRGKISTRAYVLFTKEEVKSLSPIDITARMKKAFEFNDHIWQRDNHIKFTAKDMATNLDYILYKCPRCGAEYEMTAENNHLTCKACGNSVEYTSYGELVPKDGSLSFERIDLWVDYEREEIDKEVLQEGFEIDKDVTCFIRNDETNKYDEVSKGKLSVSAEKLEYKSNMGETLTYSTKEESGIVTKNSEGVDLVIEGKTYRFLFDEHKWSFKYNLIVEESYYLRHNLK